MSDQDHTHVPPQASKVTWNTAPLRDWLKSTHANASVVILKLDSVGRSIELFRCHVFSARDATKEFFNPRSSLSLETFELALGGSEEFSRAQVVAQANTVACTVAAMSVYDQFAQLLNAAVISNPIRDRECDVEKVTKELPECPLKSRLKSAQAKAEYKYVRAFANTSKHRGVINQSFTIDAQSSVANLRFDPFIYGKTTYPAQTISEVLIQALAVKNEIIHCGKLLNSQLLGT
jgi:hypothetical protein